MFIKESTNHDDMLWILGTGIAWANQWNVKAIGDTLYPLWFLRDNSNDFTVVRIQSPHWRKHWFPLDSIHAHYVLDTAWTAGQTLEFTTYHTWVLPHEPVPALSSWVVTPSTLTLDVNTPARYYWLCSFVDAVPPPVTEWYWLFLLVRVVRWNGTYAGEMWILDVDAHAIKDRMWSINEFTD